MGSIDMIKPLSTVQSSAVNKSQQHQEKNYWKWQESIPGLLGVKRERYPFCYAAHTSLKLFTKWNRILHTPITDLLVMLNFSVKNSIWTKNWSGSNWSKKKHFKKFFFVSFPKEENEYLKNFSSWFFEKQKTELRQKKKKRKCWKPKNKQKSLAKFSHYFGQWSFFLEVFLPKK